MQRALKKAEKGCYDPDIDRAEIIKSVDEYILISGKLAAPTEEDERQKKLAYRMKGYAEFSAYMRGGEQDNELLWRSAHHYDLGGDVLRSDPPEVGIAYVILREVRIVSKIGNDWQSAESSRKRAFLAAKRLLGDHFDFDTSPGMMAILLSEVIYGFTAGLDGKPDIAAAEKACERYRTLDGDFSQDYIKGKEAIEKARRRIAEEEWQKKGFFARLFTKPKYR